MHYHSIHDVTISNLGHASSLEVGIEYFATPGEARVLYNRDGSGCPGSPPECELQSVHVTRWYVGAEQRNRVDSWICSWIWKDLDKIASAIIDDDWNDYSADCLKEAAAHTEDIRY